EAIKDLVNQISIEGIKPIIVKSGVGGINENDVMIGKSSKSIIIGFNVKPMKNISDSAAQAGIKILFYDIIYKLQDDITKMMEGTLDPIVKEEETGEAIIQQIWQHSKVGTIAGCKCTTGTVYRNDNARVLRDGAVLYKTKIGSMKHFKDEVSKISNGQEFGITLEKINDLKVGDVIQCYKIVKETK
ncbi:MAG: translation initiation factor IF-2, partial [Mycoplasmataceae bacterium]|nr:translation initiation factor IF-2 [Mycoplasmataceae bacterium]